MNIHAEQSLRICVLGSGSSGNCVVVEGPSGIVLLDSGFSPRETRRRMELRGFSPASVRTVVLTHPDTDHLNSGWKRAIGGLTGPRLLVRDRHGATVHSMGYDRAWFDEFTGGFDACGIRFEPFPMPHDSLGSTAFRISVGNRCVAHATDCGRTSPRLEEFLTGADILLLESNYDPAMQRASNRPPFLIDRIMNGRGHLSNTEAMQLARAVDRAQPVAALVLLHLSRQCNCPKLVARMYAEHAPELHARLMISAQDEPAAVLTPAPRLHHATLFGE